MSKRVDGPYSSIALPSLALNEWEATKETLHRYAQIVDKVRLEYSPFRNHWWHVPFYVDPRGLSARHMFSGELPTRRASCLVPLWELPECLLVAVGSSGTPTHR
jgi:hypothetical protein